MIRTSLSNLDRKIKEIGNYIIQFNSRIQMLLYSLKALGETTTDLNKNLFKGYVACSDKNFVKYIGERQEAWEDGREKITAEGLMLKSANRYKTLKTKELW